jgi:hypothetical protein
MPSMSTSPIEDYFSLQVQFAQRYAQTAGVPWSEAIAKCTNFRRRFGLASSAGELEWKQFLCRLPDDVDHATVLRQAIDFHGQCRASEAKSHADFGCFSYEPPDGEGTLRIHFMPHEAQRQESPLGVSRRPQRMAELRDMFSHIRSKHSQARSVRGISWLYNLDAYKRLFPPDYVASAARPSFPLHLNGSSTWGQVLNHRQAVKPEVREALLGNLSGLNVHAPWQVFPLHALVATGPVPSFYEWYG